MQLHYPIVACCPTTAFLIIDYQAFCVVKSILQIEFSRYEH